jgi:hypothetical protein
MGDPLAALNWMERPISTNPSGGRWIGYLSYDLGRWFERLPARSADDLGLPLFVFTYHRRRGRGRRGHRRRMRAEMGDCGRIFLAGIMRRLSRR